jgi:hypothetical protein
MTDKPATSEKTPAKTTAKQPPAAWFRFSLRTMFVVITVLCCWLGWESSVVRGRQNTLRELRTKPGVDITTATAWKQRFSPGLLPEPPAKISTVRTWLGDEAIQEIGYVVNFSTVSSEDEARIRRVFPEARLVPNQLHLEPCHPGCFPRGTEVATPRGPRLIEEIEPGDLVTTVLPTGETKSIPAQHVFITSNRLWEIETTAGTLITTETQPLCLQTYQTHPAGELQPGDVILRYQEGEVQPARVLAATKTDRIEKVFNLILRDCEIFVAGSYLARSKPPAKLAAQ